MTPPHRARRAASAAFLASVVLSAYALLAPDVQGPGLVELPGEDKLVHVVLFALLATTARWRFGGGLAVVLALVSYAALSEVVQATWLDGRSGDVLDLVADVVGITAGWALGGGWRPSVMGSVPGDDPT